MAADHDTPKVIETQHVLMAVLTLFDTTAPPHSSSVELTSYKVTIAALESDEGNGSLAVCCVQAEAPNSGRLAIQQLLIVALVLDEVSPPQKSVILEPGMVV